MCILGTGTQRNHVCIVYINLGAQENPEILMNGLPVCRVVVVIVLDIVHLHLCSRFPTHHHDLVAHLHTVYG